MISTSSCRYTLGGFYLARYADSPVGQFDEVCQANTACNDICIHGAWCNDNSILPSMQCAQLVALAGLVWNAPTSCAWAARVYVSNR